jgi:predicted nucleotidyltransferase
VLRDDFHAGSDVDMLVEFDPDVPVGYLAMMRMQRDLSTMVGRPVDLRTRAELSPHFRQMALDTAEVQYVPR